MRKVICLFLLCASAAISNADPVPNAYAVQFRGGEAHRGEYKEADRFGKVNIKWIFKSNSAIRSSPLRFGNKILFGSGDHYFYALDTATGKVVWKFLADAPVHSSPAVHDKFVYFSSRANTLYALELSTGKLAWKKSLGKDLPYDWGFDYYIASPLVSGNYVYIGSGDGTMYAIEAGNGRTKWTYNSGERIRSTAAADSEKIYFGDVSGKVHALNKENGNMAWKFSTIGDTLKNENFGFDRKAIIASPAIADDKIIVGSRDGYLYALNSATGNQEWRYNYEVSWVISSVAVKDNKVISGTSDGSFVHALNLSDGKEIWRFRTTAPVWASPCIVNSKVLAAVNDGFIYCLDLETGKENWRYRTNDRIFSSPLPSNGNIYCGSDDGNLYSLKGVDPSPGNDVHRAVFWIRDPVFQFFRSGSDMFIRDYFTQAGYARVDVPGLIDFLKKRIEDGEASVIVFATNIFPYQAVDSGATSMLLSYLSKGGKVVVLGNNPAAFKIDEEKKQMQGLDFALAAKRIGINFPHKDLRSIEGFYSSNITKEGKEWGLKSPINSLGVPPDLATTILATSETGRAAAWVKNYGGKRGTGFVQLWITPATLSLLPEIYSVAEFGLNE